MHTFVQLQCAVKTQQNTTQNAPNVHTFSTCFFEIERLHHTIVYTHTNEIDTKNGGFHKRQLQHLSMYNDLQPKMLD